MHEIGRGLLTKEIEKRFRTYIGSKCPGAIHENAEVSL